jgi:hypothetical protein
LGFSRQCGQGTYGPGGDWTQTAGEALSCSLRRKEEERVVSMWKPRESLHKARQLLREQGGGGGVGRRVLEEHREG